MRNAMLFSVLMLLVLLSAACKSKPAPSGDAQVPAVTATAASATAPGTTSTTTNIPASTPGAEYGTASGTTSGSTGNRHQSGIILDGATSYIVVRGDTLTGIARRLYQDGSLYPLIMMVSDNVTDPDQIEPQMRLTIPVLRTNMNDPTARQSINRYFLQIAQIEEQRGRSSTAALIRNHTR